MKKTLFVTYGKSGDTTLFDLSQKGEYGCTQTRLRASKLDPQWTRPGEVLAHMTGDGSGYNVTLGGNKFRLDYSEAEYLYHVLKAAYFYDGGAKPKIRSFKR